MGVPPCGTGRQGKKKKKKVSSNNGEKKKDWLEQRMLQVPPVVLTVNPIPFDLQLYLYNLL